MKCTGANFAIFGTLRSEKAGRLIILKVDDVENAVFG